MRWLPLLLLALPRTALAAAAPPPPPPPVPLTALAAHGRVALEDVSVTVRCDVSGHPAPSGSCHVEAHFALVAVGPTRLDRFEPARPGWGPEPDAPRIVDGEGEPLSTPLELARGERVAVRVSATRRLRTEVEPTLFLMMSPMTMRHLLLGESREVRRRGDGVSGALVEGQAVEVRGPVHVDATDAGPVVVGLAGEEVVGVARRAVDRVGLSLTLEPDPGSELPIQPGGPVLLAGAAGPLDASDDELRFSLGAAYELGVTDYLFVSAAFETDFHSIMESVVVEAASPFILLLPGVFAGAGVVFRQLGDRDPDAAFRIRLGAQMPVVGVAADLDYWPTIGEWTGSIRARLSL